MTIVRTRFRVTLQARPSLAERTEEVWADSFDEAAERAREEHPRTWPIAVEVVLDDDGEAVVEDPADLTDEGVTW